MSVARAVVPEQGAVPARLVRPVDAASYPLDELRDQLVTAVNHEVRTPLAVIMGHLELINERRELLPEGLAWSLDAIDRAAQHLDEVVETISEIADGSLGAIPRRTRCAHRLTN